MKQKIGYDTYLYGRYSRTASVLLFTETNNELLKSVFAQKCYKYNKQLLMEQLSTYEIIFVIRVKSEVYHENILMPNIMQY